MFLSPPQSVFCRARKKVWWRCASCGYGWETSVVVRSRNGSGCPACAGNVVTDINRLSVRFPELVLEWDHSKNVGVGPEDVSFGAARSVFWRCSKCSYSWKATVNKRTSERTGCPACAGKDVTDNNRLSALYPGLVKEWDFSKNKGLTPDTVTYGSEKKVWWLCPKCGHSWLTTVNNRTNDGRGCIVCTGRVATPHSNLLVACPSLCAEWDHSKNKVPPTEFTRCSNKKVWWVCSVCGYNYCSSIWGRVVRGRGCSKCAEGNISASSQRWLDGFNNPDMVRECPVTVVGKRYKVDGFDPQTNTIYEYFGRFWHGHPDFYPAEQINPRTHTTFGFLYSKTIERIDLIRKSGYNLIYVWGK